MILLGKQFLWAACGCRAEFYFIQLVEFMSQDIRSNTLNSHENSSAYEKDYATQDLFISTETPFTKL